MDNVCKALDKNTLAVTTSVSRELVERRLKRATHQVKVWQAKIAELQAQIEVMDALK